jgi:signal transduction histidine kinase/ligand-binding sensor domain-containing protein
VISNCRKQIKFYLCGCFLGMVLTPSLLGLDREVQISQLHHTLWNDENAGIGAINEVVQTSDGFLWLRTSDNRLLRFDGVRFQPIETTIVGVIAPVEHWWETIAGIQAEQSGGLWIAHATHSISIDLVKDGVDRAFPTQQCIPRGYPTGFVEEQNGVLWIKTSEGLARLQNGHCEAIGKNWGYSGKYPLALLMDKQGTLWEKDSDGRLFFLRRGSTHFEVNMSGTGAPGLDGSLAQAPDGSIWQSGPYGMQQIIQGRDDQPMKRAPVRGPYSAIGKFIFDRDGALWFRAFGGLHRIPHPEELVPWRPSPGEFIKGKPPQLPAKDHVVLQNFTTAQGLSSDDVTWLFEDREGDIWASTAGGLDQFRNNMFIKAPLPRLPVQQIALSSGSSGSVWAANWYSPMFHLGKELLGTGVVDKENVATLYSDPNGVTWVGTAEAVWRSTTQGFRRAARSPTSGPEYVIAMSANPGGGLWVSLARSGIFLLHDGIWTHQNSHLDISNDIAVDAIATDDRGRVWFDSGDITVLDGDRVQKIKTTHGYATCLNVTGLHTWMGGVSGLGLLMAAKFQVIHGVGDQTFRGVTGIIERANGDLWINTIAGVVRISSAEIQHEISDPNHLVGFQLFDALDGLEGKANNWLPAPTATAASDGSLWFGTNKGVFRVDPESLGKQIPVAPQVFVTSLTLDGKKISVLDSARLSPHTQNLQIEYTTPSFVTPERLNFSYKLEGADRKWQDAGTRRQAFYTNLSPGHYRFLVKTSNGSGVPGVAAELRFVIEAAWYQTIWFRCLCALAVIGVLWCVYRLRLMQITARFHERMGDRLRERERIARELHDTLLQGFQSIILRFQVTANAIAPGDTARSMMEDTLSRADAVLIEGRQRVRDLRSQENSDGDLADELRCFIADSEQENSGRFHFDVEGEEIPLHPVVREEIFAIVREALINAMQHSQASEIACKLQFDRKQFLCECCDNGIGIDPEILAAGGKRDHWGLIGMRERARKVGAEIRVQRMPERGTRVDVRLPARIAYAEKSQRAF